MKTVKKTCSTPFGITAFFTRDYGPVGRRTHSAQRLSASRPSSLWEM